MKLSEFKNEDALDLLADILEPAARIFSDKAVADAARAGKQADAVKAAIKGHKEDVIAIVAALHKTAPDKCEFDVLTLTKDVLEILNDEELQTFFTSQVQTEEESASGSATENTEGTEATSEDL